MSPKSVNELKAALKQMDRVRGETSEEEHAIQAVKKTLQQIVRRYGAGGQSGWAPEEGG